MNTRIFVSLMGISLLAACGAVPQASDQTPSRQVGPPPYGERKALPEAAAPAPTMTFNPATADAAQVDQWLRDAELAPPEEGQELLLQAAEVLLREGEAARADDVVSSLIIPELQAQQAVRLALIRARVLRGQGQFKAALAQLAEQFVEQAIIDAPLNRQLQYSHLRASLFALEGQHLAAAQERIYIAPLMQPGQRQQNREDIWSALMQVPTEELVAHVNNADNRDYLGWLELAAIAKDNQGDVERQLQQRDAWLARWPQHPAREQLPGGLDKLEKLVVERPEKVALLLPVSGRLAAYGKAIRDGFYAAYYQAQAQGAKLPRLQQYDSGEADPQQLYQQAIRDGAKLVIGPLQKQNLAALLSGNDTAMSVPTLALNRIPGQQFPNGLYQFGLNPEDEAIQIAHIAANKGFRRAMVVIPEGDWGSKVAQAFIQEWEARGGTVVTSTHFDAGKNNYSKQIRDGLQIDDSLRRRNGLQQIIGRAPEFEPYRRSDMDFIFLVARPNEGRAIKPMLAYHYAGDVPVYATSHIYGGNDNPDRDQDINDVYFIDIPWMFDQDSDIRKAINDELPHSANYQRMYALGVDSFRLHLRLAQLHNDGGGRVFGETGTLSLNDRRQIERKLSLAQIRNGRAVTVPMAETTRSTATESSQSRIGF